MCVLFVNQVGGHLLLEFEPDGTAGIPGYPVMRTISSSTRSEAALQIKELRRDKEELLASLELFYRVFFLNEETEHA